MLMVWFSYNLLVLGLSIRGGGGVREVVGICLKFFWVILRLFNFFIWNSRFISIEVEGRNF